jgi:steroid delta-isomerase-like uncharacterized protein
MKPPLAAIVTSVLLLGIAGRVSAETAEELARNKKVARMVYEEGLSQGRFDLTDPLYAADFVGHGGARDFTHAEGLAEATGWRAAFPDLTVTVDLMLAEGDLVAVRWTARGTNTGSGNGLPATGRSVAVSGTTVFRLVAGRIAEEWTAGDALGLLRQLGLTPGALSNAAAEQ